MLPTKDEEHGSDEMQESKQKAAYGYAYKEADSTTRKKRGKGAERKQEWKRKRNICMKKDIERHQ